MKCKRFIVWMCLIQLTISAQDLVYSTKYVGFNVGANVALGTHFQRFGFTCNFFYVNNFFQSNSEARVYFSFKNLGPDKIYKELVLSQGLVFGYGSKVKYFNPFLNSVSNQTNYSNSIAYSYNAFFNKVKTKQQTGIAAFQFNNVSIIIENDILAKPLLDRFRTGAFLIQYQYKDQFQAAINCTMWTGEMGHRVDNTMGIKAKCYIDTVGSTYGGYSHGLLSAQFKYNIGLGQNVQANFGVDAEQVRNAVQNRLIHDMIFIPRKWFTPVNCHIPMIDEKGGQYLYKPEQKIRKPKPYWNVFSNANLFY